ncbi:MAG: hypothetical protein IJZ68_06350 [Bacteroidaceae bacterium]|nr:hypothetical protein [Bacteroidaceae bacterium]
MKKILAILLACAMVFAMAACANTDNPDNTAPEGSTPSQSGDNSTTNTEPTTGGDNVTEPSDGYTWEIKDVATPTFADVELQKLTAVEGHDAQATVVVSPWKLEDYNLEEMKTTLQNSALFKDWVFGIEETERGNATNYKEVGYMVGYEWEKSIVGTNEYYDTMSWVTDVEMMVAGETEKAIGYTDIRLDIEIPVENVTKEMQDEIAKLLVELFGEEYGTFLCYAPTVEKNCLLEVHQDNATIYFRRETTEYGLMFRMHMSPQLGYKMFDSYPGPGDYVSIVDTPSYVYQLLNENIGAVNVHDFGNIGDKMLKENYVDYDGTMSDYSSAYYMRTVKLDNGHTVESFELNAMVGQKEVAKLISTDFVIDYEVVHNGTAVTDVELKFECGVGITGDEADLEATRTEFFNRGAKMLQCILKDDINPAEVITKGEDGKHQVYQWETSVLGLTKSANMSFAIGTTMADTMVGYIYYNIY